MEDKLLKLIFDIDAKIMRNFTNEELILFMLNRLYELKYCPPNPFGEEVRRRLEYGAKLRKKSAKTEK